MEIRVQVGWGELGADLQDDLVQEIATELGMNTKWVRQELERHYNRGGFCGTLEINTTKLREE